MADSISIGAAYRDQKIVGGVMDNTPIGATTASTGAFTTLTASGATTLAALTATGNIALGDAAADTIGFYGTTPAAQRAAANQAASVVSANSYISVTSNLAAFCAEVAATLTGLGLWKGSA